MSTEPSSPPASSAQGDPLSPAAPPEPSGRDERGIIRRLIDHYFADSSDLPARKRTYFIALCVVLGVSALIGGLWVESRFHLITAESSVRAETEAEREIDSELPPFSAQITEPVFDPHTTPFGFVFDRPLTQEEQQQLLSFVGGESDKVWSYLSSIGGRMLQIPSDCCVSPAGVDTPDEGNADVFNMHLFSSRQAPLAINELRANILECYPPETVALVQVPPQGGGQYLGLVFDLSAREPVARISDSVDQQGEPFFWHNAINLGNGADPGNLRVESVVEGETCEWEIEADYADATGTHTEIIRDGGEPFITEARPWYPQQHWIMIHRPSDGEWWTDCLNEPDSLIRETTCF